MKYQNDIKDVACLPIPWDKLDGCNILVAGATGLIGSCLVEVLMSHPNRNYNVYVMGRNEQRINRLFDKYELENDFYKIKADVVNTLSLNYSFHYIINCASGAAPSVFVNHPVEVMKSNFIGVINLLEYGLKHEMKRFLYISSGEIYGEGDGREFTEEYSGYVDCSISRSCYPSSKRAAETLCASYVSEYGADIVIARPCHVYGPHFTEGDNRVYAQFIRNILRGENIIMKSTGEQLRSWCYVVDCVSALLFILLKGKKGQAYNIADDNSNISIKQLAEMIAEIGNKKVIIEIPSDIERQGYNVVSKSIFNTSKIKSLGWKVTGTMYEKMLKTINYFVP